MGESSALRELIRTLVDKDFNTPTAAVHDLTPAEATAAVAAAFTTAVSRKFDRTTDVGEIATYIAGLRAQSQGASDDIKPAIAEALIRAALGEQGLLTGLPRSEFVTQQINITYAIIAEEQLADEQLERFLDEVEELMAGNL